MCACAPAPGPIVKTGVRFGERGSLGDTGYRSHGCKWTMRASDRCFSKKIELELEVIQPHMAQKPVLRGEVGCACVAREVSVERGGMGERGCARQKGSKAWSPSWFTVI